MPYYPTIPANITSARSEADSAARTYGEVSAQVPSVPDVLKQKIIEAYKNSEDLVLPLDQATKTYLSAPAVGRGKYQNIFNPFQRESLISQYVGNESLPMLSLSNIYGNRVGRIEDTIGAGVRGFQTVVAAKQAEAEAKRQIYQDLLSEYKLTEDLKQREFDNNLALKKLAMSGSGTGINGVTKTNQLTAETWTELQFDDISEKQRSADDIANILRRDEAALRMAGVDVNSLWEWQRNMKALETANSEPQTTSKYNYQPLDLLFGKYSDPVQRQQEKNKFFGGLNVDLRGINTGSGAVGAAGY